MPWPAPWLTGLFVDSEFALALADAKGVSTTSVRKPMVSDLTVFTRLNEILQPEGLRLQPDAHYPSNGGIVHLINIRALDATSRHRSLPGSVPYDWHTGWDGLVGWQRRLHASLKAAQRQGRLPADWNLSALVEGIEYGYPDTAICDFQELKVAGRNVEHLHRVSIPNSTCYRRSTTFMISNLHESNQDVVAAIEQWGNVLHDFYRDPVNLDLATDVTFLKSQDLLLFDRPADRPTALFLDTWGFKSHVQQFEVTLQQGRPLSRLEDGGKAAALLWTALLPSGGSRLAAALAQPEAVLTLAGARARSGWLTVPFPTAEDLQGLDRINAVLVPRGVSVETSVFFLEDGQVKIINLGALERITAQTSIPGSVPFRFEKGWLHYFTWQVLLLDQALRQAQATGLLAGDADIWELEDRLFSGDPDVVETVQVPQAKRRSIPVEANLPHGYAPPSVQASTQESPRTRARLSELASTLDDFYQDIDSASLPTLRSYVADVRAYQKSLLTLTRLEHRT